MWQTSALFITCLAVTFIYLSNEHQAMIKYTLSKKIRIVGYFCWLCALAFWLEILTTSAAIFMWLLTSVVLFILLPLLSLCKSKGGTS